MLLPMRRLLVPVFAVSLMVGGLAYAAGDLSSDETTLSPQSTGPGAELETGDGTLQTQAESEDTAEDGTIDPTGSSGVTSTGRSTEGCPQGFSGNHGQYVSATEEQPRRDAAHSPCGKPLQSVHEDGSEEPATETVESEDDDGPGLKKGHSKDKGKRDS